ncbi:MULTISPECIES: LutC/YkgG family protein [unclassified Janthinobacterium]|uniref:LutC/YkgG family protein n=1 Tax=unclassified Janthinobacterium TaxID=2610881 RepID=UPI00034C446C|nr:MULTISPECIES: lactate utilization protein [unclassified Janthinobacterium]MEC5159520.1 L-lactate dehydrogenase complex protein LldG [Janthinobacterium sp. CG_S6]
MSAMGSRERMLGRLRAANPSAPAPVEQLDGRIDEHYDGRRARASNAQLVRAMQAALTASHAEVWCAEAAAWPAQLAEKLAAHGVLRLLLDPASAEGAALARALPAGVEALPFARPLEHWKGELFDSVDAGFTVARSGIAATGTLVLAPDRGSPRSASLVPPLHVALVHADTLHADLHAAARAERWADGMPSNLVLASGPSKTSDIQQTLAYGAHGPRWMWVIIVVAPAAQAAAATGPAA